LILGNAAAIKSQYSENSDIFQKFNNSPKKPKKILKILPKSSKKPKIRKNTNFSSAAGWPNSAILPSTLKKSENFADIPKNSSKILKFR
jgi:hypothetical protein